MDGNRTSNFAVPIAVGEWTTLGHEPEEKEARRLTQDGDIYYQVDVNVCSDKAEFERMVFYHSYGDLGMIMGLLARNVGLTLGEKGLKVRAENNNFSIDLQNQGLQLPDPPNPPIELSQSFNEILEFMGWSMDTWKAGFLTKREIFEWAGSTRFFNPGQFRSHGEGFRKVKTDRKMYAEFVQWAGEKTALAGEKKGRRTEEQLQELRGLALVHFNKKDLFDTLAREREQRAGLKQAWSGSRVRDWAELGNYWKGVKLIMDAVRERLGGDEGVTKLYEKEGEDGIKRVVLEEKKRLSISSVVREESADITSVEGNLARDITNLSVT
ncbi:hypothetical protein C0993_012295 [Termitomyces sp. T159_Od127]|nr:hypothetical protein C0993_012295 [Termitomyces sp. T159_Od127]